MPTRKFPRPKFPPLIVTPWAWPSELPEIRSVIYRTGPNAPPAEDKRQKAVNLMEAWKLRGRLPHAMDATCLLLNAILNGQNSGVTPLSARSVYAVAWARFVTGFCDIGKNAAISKSMFKVAHEIGMPEYFVELRHDIAHQGLPSMQRLAQAAEEGMAWLWTHFWVDLETKGVIPVSKALESSNQGKAQIESVLADFRTSRKHEIRDARIDNAAATNAVRVLVGIVRHHDGGLLTLATCLIKTGHLVPKKREWSDPMDFTYTFWDALLRSLSTRLSNFAPILLKHLTLIALQTAAVDTSNDPFCEALFEWIDHILFSADWGSIRRRYDQAMRGEVLKVCHGGPSDMAKALVRKSIRSGRKRLFKRTQSQIFAQQILPWKKRKL